MTEKKPPRAINEGTIKLANDTIEIPCAVLEDGRRLVVSRAMMTALGRPWKGSYKRTELPNFVAAPNLKPFIREELLSVLNTIDYVSLKGRQWKGYQAQLLPLVCEVYLAARDAGELRATQRPIATQAEILMRGLAHVGIIALVDEATGYQEIRDRDALQKILDKYLRDEFAAWAKTFPDDFYQQIFRLRGWQWKGMRVNRPSVVAHYTNDLVYARLALGVLKELQRLNPRVDGKRSQKHTQWLTPDVGIPALKDHLTGVTAIMRGASSWEQSQRMIQRAYPKINTNLDLPIEYPEDKQ